MQNYEDNTSTLIDRGDYGLKVSLPGYDVRQSQDIDLVFSSAWPSMQIVNKTNKDNTFSGGRFEHGLGYPPLAIGYNVNTPGGNYEFMNVDERYVYVSLAVPDECIITNIDISKDVEYPITGTQSYRRPYDPDYGIKIAKKGKDVNSKDLRDFSLHSRAQSLMLLATKTQETIHPGNPQNVIQYTSPLDRTAIFIPYVRGIGATPNMYVNASMNYAQSYPIAYSDGRRCNIEWLTSQGSNGASIVCLRNPFFAPVSEEIII